MRFDEALLVIDGVREIINREDIANRPDFLEVIENLHCAEPGCGVKLVYNQKSTGLVYLSKHRSFKHSESCPLFEDKVTAVKSITEYTEVNGKLAADGVKRRKSESHQALLDFFNPPEKEVESVKGKKKKNPPITKKDETTTTKPGIKVTYDPNGEVVEKSDENGGVTVKEPPFYKRLPHQISVKDRNKNLCTSALIENIKIGSNPDIPTAEISASFDDKKLVFVMPEVFFQGNERGLSRDQLIEYFIILKDYIKRKPNIFFLTSLCQSQNIDLDEIVLYVLEPDFMSFQTKSGVVYPTLSSMIAAISTGAI